MIIDDAINLSRTILAFGQVFRITKDEQGRPESDTTHTVMLALLAATVWAEEEKPLALSEVLLFALVHDLAETFAGDTPTLYALDADARAAKEARKADARDKLAAVLPPWVMRYIDRYEAQSCPEARFVRYLDKVTPKLTHAGNKGASVREQGMTLDELIDRHRTQGDELGQRYPGFRAAAALFDAACLASEAEYEAGNLEAAQEPS